MQLLFFGPCPAAHRILVPQPGMELTPLRREAWSLKPWTTRDVLMQLLTNTNFSNHDIGHQVVKEVAVNSPDNSKFPVQGIIQLAA